MKAKTIFGILIILLGIILIMGVTNVQSQPIFEENFDYPDGHNLTDHGWIAFSSGGTNPITVSSPGLTYTGYQSVSGNAALLDASGEDVRNIFGPTTSNIYVSFLVNVSSAPSGGDYFLFLNPATLGGSHRARVYVKSGGSGIIEFGLGKSTETPTYTSNNYSANTTYLLVLKYKFNSGTDDDEVSLFVIDGAIPSSEPATPTIGPISGATDLSDAGNIALRQGTSATNLKVDGIRIGYTWGDAPIPVELTSFTAIAASNQVKLNWSTATETENLGFHVFRSLTKDNEYQKITQELIRGSGSSDKAHSYNYIDLKVEAGITYYYKLADVDFSGNITFHGPISAAVTNSPGTYTLEQSYPNPFNPETTISFSLKEKGMVSLKIYNLQGQLIRSLIDDEMEPGIHSIIWNAMDDRGMKVAVGVYLYSLKVNGFEATKKLNFIK